MVLLAVRLGLPVLAGSCLQCDVLAAHCCSRHVMECAGAGGAERGLGAHRVQAAHWQKGSGLTCC